MIFTEEQIRTLSQWEEHFRTATRSNWARNPGRGGLLTIHSIYTRATGDKRRFSDSCGVCILNLLRDVGEIYFNDIRELKARDNTTKAVEVAPGPNKRSKRAKLKFPKEEGE